MNDSPPPPRGPALALFTRVPGAGPAKTRLAREIGPARAEALARAFLLDTLARVRTLDVALSLWFTPPEAEAALRQLLRTTSTGSPGELAGTPRSQSAKADFVPLLPPVSTVRCPLTLLPQSPDTLDHRLEAALNSLLAQGHDRVCVIGSNSPTLPLEWITAAFEALIAADFVLIPTKDGGFALLGARRCGPGLLAGIEWSSEQTFAQTRERLAACGTVEVFGEWYDIDTRKDLDCLLLDPALADCPATRAVLLG